jgi:hypothetical protein
MYAHGCFRFDCPPYHEQSEYLLSIYVIPRLISNGRVATPPNLTCVKTQSMEFIVLYLHKSYFVFNLIKKKSSKCHSKKCFVEYQLSRGQNGLSPLSTAHRRILQHSTVRSIIIWPWKDHLASGLISVT